MIMKRKKCDKALSILKISMNDKWEGEASRRSRNIKKRCENCHAFKDDCICNKSTMSKKIALEVLDSEPFAETLMSPVANITSSGKRKGRPPNSAKGMKVVNKDIDPFLSENNTFVENKKKTSKNIEITNIINNNSNNIINNNSNNNLINTKVINKSIVSYLYIVS